MLQKLFNKYGCDKASKHHYDLVYESEFALIREQHLAILEVGVFKGESTQAWADYFPNAKIFGLDVFTRVSMNQIPILNHPRVEAICGSSIDITITEEIRKKWPGVKFDIIIDDGLHTPRANADTFKNLFPLLKQGGAYYIEDVWPLHIMSESEKNHWWLKKYPDLYNDDEMQYFMDQIPKNKLVEFDLRKKSGHPDSYIMKI
jgi:cephalosporin hydroxylase